MLLTHSWQQWIKDFVIALNWCVKWSKEHPNVKLGDVVIIISPDTPRGHWSLGSMEDVYLGPDGKICVVRTWAQGSSMLRPMTNIFPPDLLVSDLSKAWTFLFKTMIKIDSSTFLLLAITSWFFVMFAAATLNFLVCYFERSLSDQGRSYAVKKVLCYLLSFINSFLQMFS